MTNLTAEMKEVMMDFIRDIPRFDIKREELWDYIEALLRKAREETVRECYIVARDVYSDMIVNAYPNEEDVLEIMLDKIGKELEKLRTLDKLTTKPE